MRATGVLFSLLLTSSSYAAVLTVDTVWSGTVVIDESLEVPPGVTLSVEPGTTVLLDNGVSVRVEGRLLASGTEAEPVLWTRHPDAANWERLMFVGAADSVLAHSIIEFADCEGDHKDYYDDTDDDCNPLAAGRPPRSYNEAVVVIASHVDIDACVFRNLPDDGSGAEGDAIAVISDDPVHPGDATAHITNSQFLSIGQGIHTRYSYVLVEDCYFTGHRGDNDDIDLYGESATPPLIRRNLFLDPDHDDMINPTRCSAVIVDNIIAGSDDHGIVLRDRCDPVLINNVIYDCSSAGIAVQNSCDALLINNTIVDCGRAVRFFDHTGRWGRPYCLTPGSGRATLINCVIWNCPTSIQLTDSPYEEEPGSHVTLVHCAIQEGEDRMSISAASTVTWGAGNIDEDPRFVDAANGDFRLEAGSPLIDAGTPDQAPDHDIDGKPRPCGDGVDIGATESGDCDVPVGEAFRRGDANADGVHDVSDPVTVLLFLFGGRSEPSCQKSADADDNGVINMTDAVFALAALFRQGEAPAAPGAVCGQDPTGDQLTCVAYDACP